MRFFMTITYQAEIIGNEIRWIDPLPIELSKKSVQKVAISFLDDNEPQNKKNDLVEFFQNSPLLGVELELERNTDLSRDIEL
jgi:hypothetical protein